MDNYFGYKNLLQSSLNSYDSKVSNANSKFQSALLENQGVKRLIEQTTQPIGDILLTGPLKDITKGVAKKAVDFLNDKINPQPQTGETVGKDVELKTINTEEGEPSPDLPETNPVQELSNFTEPENMFGNSINDLPAGMSSQEMELFGKPKSEDPSEWLNKTADEAKENQPVSQTEDEVQLNEKASLEQTAKNSSSATDAENAAKTSGEAAGEEGGEVAAEGGELAAEGGELAADTALLADPLTAIFGLILGVGTIVGGIEGADSVKSPSLPKLPHIANVATQFGIGN